MAMRSQPAAAGEGHSSTAAHVTDLVRRTSSPQDRRRADVEVYLRLERAGFSGPAFDKYATELVRYSVAVVRKWLRTGEMFRQSAERRRPLGSVPHDWSAADREELALETVTQAVRLFRAQALAGRGWSPDGGASLATYFMGTCVSAFPNVYRAFQRERDRWRGVELVEQPPETPVHTIADDPLSTVLARQALRDALASLDTDTARVLVLVAMGYTQRQIAVRLRRTPRAIEGILYRHRKAIGCPDPDPGGLGEQ